MIIWLLKEIKKDKGEMIERQTRNRENIVVTNVDSAFVTRIIQELQDWNAQFPPSYIQAISFFI